MLYVQKPILHRQSIEKKWIRVGSRTGQQIFYCIGCIVLLCSFCLSFTYNTVFFLVFDFLRCLCEDSPIFFLLHFPPSYCAPQPVDPLSPTCTRVRAQYITLHYYLPSRFTTISSKRRETTTTTAVSHRRYAFRADENWFPRLFFRRFLF